MGETGEKAKKKKNHVPTASQDAQSGPSPPDSDNNHLFSLGHGRGVDSWSRLFVEGQYQTLFIQRF